MSEQPMSAADYRARADATRRENEELDRLEAEEEARRKQLLSEDGCIVSAGGWTVAETKTPLADAVMAEAHADDMRRAIASAERVPAGAEMAKCSTCRQEFPRDYIANGVCATCRREAGWVNDRPSQQGAPK